MSLEKHIAEIEAAIDRPLTDVEKWLVKSAYAAGRLQELGERMEAVRS